MAISSRRQPPAAPRATGSRVLTITETGFGKRTSSYEYRTTHRGGSGIANIKIADKTKAVVSSFPIEENENILMVTDGGKMIRLGVNKIRIAGRQTMGVTLLKTAEDEKVVSSAIIKESEEDEETPIVQDNTPQEVSTENSEIKTEEITPETNETSEAVKTDLFE